MYDVLISEAKEALESDDQERIISVIRKLILSVPDEITDEAISIFLNQ